VHSDLATNSFAGAANATRDVVYTSSDLIANSFDGAANATQTKLICLLI
jgi:hypothetical protein